MDKDRTKFTRITVLVSGSGTNLQALIDACKSGALKKTQIVRVICNRKDAYGRTRAREAEIPETYHNLFGYKQRYPDPESKPKQDELDRRKYEKARSEYDRDLAAIVMRDEPDLVVCAGWMHILANTFLEPLQAAKIPVINLHPALPGAFDGANAIERAFTAFQEGKVAETGVMIHYVISEVDRGEPILIRKIPMRGGEVLEQLEERIHQNEWEVIVQGTQMAIDRLLAEQKRE